MEAEGIDLEGGGQTFKYRCFEQYNLFFKNSLGENALNNTESAHKMFIIIQKMLRKDFTKVKKMLHSCTSARR